VSTERGNGTLWDGEEVINRGEYRLEILPHSGLFRISAQMEVPAGSVGKVMPAMANESVVRLELETRESLGMRITNVPVSPSEPSWVSLTYHDGGEELLQHRGLLPS